MASSSSSKARGSAPTSRRLATGTHLSRGFTDLTDPSLCGLRKKSPEAYLAEYKSGMPFYVQAFAYGDGGFRQGRLVLETNASPPIVWQPRRLFPRYGRAVPLAQPYRIMSLVDVAGRGSRKTDPKLTRMLMVSAGRRNWRLAIATVDVDLVRWAIIHES